MTFNRVKQALTYIVKNNGISDTQFLYNLKTILANIDETGIHIDILNHVLLEALENKTPLSEILISIETVSGSDILQDLVSETKLEPQEISEIKTYVNEEASVIKLKKTLTSVEDELYKILNSDTVISSLQLKEKFSELVGKLFSLSSQINKNTDISILRINKETIEDVFSNLEKYYIEQRLVIPFELLDYDKFLKGLHSSRLYTIVMRSGEGKSTVMVDFSKRVYKYAVNNYESVLEFTQGLRPCVYYFTFENELEESSERLFSSFVSQNISDANSLQKSKEHIKNMISDNVDYIMYYRGSFTTSAIDIVTFLESEKLLGNYPVAIFVDYLGIMLPSDRIAEKRLQLERVTADLKNIAVQYKVPVITGMQVKKDSFNSDRLTLSDIKESSGIIDNSDVIILKWRLSDNEQDPVLVKQGIVKYGVSIGKQRHGISNVEWRTVINFPHFSIEEPINQLTVQCEPPLATQPQSHTSKPSTSSEKIRSLIS